MKTVELYSDTTQHYFTNNYSKKKLCSTIEPSSINLIKYLKEIGVSYFIKNNNAHFENEEFIKKSCKNGVNDEIKRFYLEHPEFFKFTNISNFFNFKEFRSFYRTNLEVLKKEIKKEKEIIDRLYVENKDDVLFEEFLEFKKYITLNKIDFNEKNEFYSLKNNISYLFTEIIVKKRGVLNTLFGFNDEKYFGYKEAKRYYTKFKIELEMSYHLLKFFHLKRVLDGIGLSEAEDQLWRNEIINTEDITISNNKINKFGYYLYNYLNINTTKTIATISIVFISKLLLF